ncbi:MAG: hypothetical protein ACTXOO_04520 [Sodalis sp. (in: enterobacteria)]
MLSPAQEAVTVSLRETLSLQGHVLTLLRELPGRISTSLDHCLCRHN